MQFPYNPSLVDEAAKVLDAVLGKITATGCPSVAVPEADMSNK